jgi:hypothetical protein
MSESWSPRFNHVAMSIERQQLANPGWRQQVADFFSEVFGWQQVEQPGGDPLVLILLAYRPSQFVFLLPGDTPMQCPTGDHFGMEVSSVAELEEFHRRAVAFRARDERVEIVAPKAEVVGPFRLTSFYVRHLLPMTLEVQHFELLGGATAPGA